MASIADNAATCDEDIQIILFKGLSTQIVSACVAEGEMETIPTMESE